MTLWTSILNLFRRRPRNVRVPTPVVRTSPEEEGDAPVVSDRLKRVKRSRRRKNRQLASTFSGHGPMARAANEVRAILDDDSDPFALGLSAESESQELLSETVSRLTDIRRDLTQSVDIAAVRILSEAVAMKRLDLPGLPDVAQELMTTHTATMLSFSELAEKVEKDQDLAARVLQVANSPIYTRVELDSLERAVGALGLPTFRNVVLGAVSEAAIYKVPGFEKEVTFQRRYALRASRIASSFAKDNYGLVAAGVASLAGLLHDAGKVLVLRNLSLAARSVGGKRTRVSVPTTKILMEQLHVPLGLYYARLRGLPRSVRVAMAHDEEPHSVHAADREIALPVAVAMLVCRSALPDGSPIQARRVAEALAIDDMPGVIESIQRASTL